MAVALALANTSPSPTPAAPDQTALEAHAKVPLSFVANRGQTDGTVRYYAQAPGFGFYLTQDSAMLSLVKGEDGHALEMRFVGANPSARLVPGRPGNAKVNYLTGAQHQTDLATYGQVTYRELWPGIDMVFRGQGGKLKYEFHVAAGADPSRIRIAYAGAEGLALGAAGNLLVGTSLGTLRDSRPVSYQRIGGERVPVTSGYALHGTSAYGFQLAPHDPRRALVIDPALEYSTYLGPPAGLTEGYAIAVDASGSAYVTGRTSQPFPTTPGAFDTTYNTGYGDVYVSKLNPTGSALVYSTYLGGTSREDALGIAVDGAGSAYITGATDSSDFPTTPGAPDPSNNGSYEAFVTKLNPAGSALAYSTFLGGTGPDQGRAIAVDANANAYVTGSTNSSDFPTTAGAFDTGPQANGAAFVTKLDAGGSFAYSTLLDGAGNDGLYWYYGIAVDGGGHAHVTGSTSSEDFPTTPGAFDTTLATGSNQEPDSFVTKLNPSGSALVYSTFLGGHSAERGAAIALDAAGNAYTTGSTESSDFPTTPGAFDTTKGYWTTDAYVTKLNPTGSALVFSTLLGGDPYDGADGGKAIAVDASGSTVVAGETSSVNFPTTPGAFDTSHDANISLAFVTKLSATGSAVAYSTLLGVGSSGPVPRGTYGRGVALDPGGRAYVTGLTQGPGFPTTAGAISNGQAPNTSFVTKLSLKPHGYPRPKTASPLGVSLVPAYAACSAPNRTHGAPLSSGSCSPPAMSSDELTLGTPDANRKQARSEGLVEYKAIAGDLTTTPDEASVEITVTLLDVYDQQTLTDYTGELRVRTTLRISDKHNDPGDIATASDLALGFTVACTATADANQGATCTRVTSVDALFPGGVVEGKRAVWELGQVQVDDGGADGDADTAADNTLFMKQGIFVP